MAQTSSSEAAQANSAFPLLSSIQNQDRSDVPASPVKHTCVVSKSSVYAIRFYYRLSAVNRKGCSIISVTILRLKLNDGLIRGCTCAMYFILLGIYSFIMTKSFILPLKQLT